MLEHWGYSAWMLMWTMYALFGDDVRLAGTSQPSDDIFYGLSSVCMAFFGIELIVASLAKDGYWLGFYFWLDLIATISMIADIGWIWDEIVGTSSGVSGGIAKSSQLTRAARASRAGTRAGRIIRIIRIVRLIRLVKLYKIAQETKLESKKEVETGYLLRSFVIYRGGPQPVSQMLTEYVQRYEKDEDLSVSQSFDMNTQLEFQGETEAISDINTGTALGFNSRRTSTNIENNRSSGPKASPEPIIEEPIEAEIAESEPETIVPAESKVGQKLSEITTKRVILLVLGMMFFLPLFSSSMYVDANTSYEYGLMVLDNLSEYGDDFDMAWDNYLAQHEGLFTPVIYLEVTSRRVWQSMDPADLRSLEKQITVLDRSQGSRNFAGLNIVRTLFVCFILSFSSLIFSNDANQLVIGPIERMTERIQRIARNPLQAVQEEETQSLALEEAGNNHKKTKEKQIMETEVLENIIVKIGALLALGFGEAGSEIITSNIKRGGGDVDPLIPGKKKYCIFGFCDIRSFAEVTEVLQEGVMVFVNEIAQIVHNVVYRFSGSANKNIGDAFLMVWKLPRHLEQYLHRPETDPCPYEMHQYADMALVGFLKVLAAINSDQRIMKYRLSSELTQRLPNYAVKMGFGLHVGWAIEGAIGSEFKIDASYLSPNVNLASRLEAATRQFGIPILASGQLFDLFSIQVQLLMRQIDCVLVKGSKVPMRLYTCDVSIANVPMATAEEMMLGLSKKQAKIDLKRQRERTIRAALNKHHEIWRLFESDNQLVTMRSKVNLRFIEMFKQGFSEYSKGNWPEARRLFLHGIEIKGEMDGPARTLLDYMDEKGGEAPEGWRGFRELTEK